MTTRVSKEPERPRRFHRQSGWGDRNRQLPGPRWDAHDRGEQTTGDTMVSAREEIERVETDGGESERPIVSLKRGNHPEGPRGEKGTPCHDFVAIGMSTVWDTINTLLVLTGSPPLPGLTRGSGGLSARSTDCWDRRTGTRANRPRLMYRRPTRFQGCAGGRVTSHASFVFACCPERSAGGGDDCSSRLGHTVSAPRNQGRWGA